MFDHFVRILAFLFHRPVAESTLVEPSGTVIEQLLASGYHVSPEAVEFDRILRMQPAAAECMQIADREFNSVRHRFVLRDCLELEDFEAICRYFGSQRPEDSLCFKPLRDRMRPASEAVADWAQRERSKALNAPAYAEPDPARHPSDKRFSNCPHERAFIPQRERVIAYMMLEHGACASCGASFYDDDNMLFDANF